MKSKSTENNLFDFEAVFEPEDYLYFYEDTVCEETTRKQTDFFVKELKMLPGMKVLDLACGHGRHSNALTELGFNVRGVDITESFLQIARENARKKNLGVEYMNEDMRKIDFSGEFDRVLLIFTAFGYFQDEENFLVLKNISKALKKGGLFCFDTFNRDSFLKYYLPFIIQEKGNDIMFDVNTFDSATGRLNSKRTVIRNGERKEKPFSVRLYNACEIRLLLERAGLKIKEIYSDWNGGKFDCFSRRMIIVSEKQ